MAANQEPNYLMDAARLLLAARVGTLATLNGETPYASLVTPAVGEDGSPLLLLSDLSPHTRHLRAMPACSLLAWGAPADVNPQTAPRLTLSAVAEQTEDAGARGRYLATHPYAELYASFQDFRIWKLFVNDAHYVGGFAAATRLDAAALQHEIMLSITHGFG